MEPLVKRQQIPQERSQDFTKRPLSIHGPLAETESAVKSGGL